MTPSESNSVCLSWLSGCESTTRCNSVSLSTISGNTDETKKLSSTQSNTSTI